MRRRSKVVGLRMAMLLVALNVWTGSPLVALWIGSRLQGSGPPQMGPVFVVVVAFAAISFTLASLLARLGDSYDRMTGQTAQSIGTSPGCGACAASGRSIRGSTSK